MTSAIQSIAKINRLLKECDENEARDLAAVNHVPHTGPVPAGRASTILGDCAEHCPCHEIRRHYYGIRTRLASVQRAALIANASKGLAGLESLNAARRTRAKITDQDYDRKALLAQNDKHLASMLGVHPVTLSRYKRQRFRRIS